MRESSRLRLKNALAKYKPRRLCREIHGYSLTKILIFGLILPAIVTACMLVGVIIALLSGLSLLWKFVTLALSTLIGFIFGTFIFLKILYQRMLRFAKIRR